eukprot:scaffold112332_cov13-Prasinocladus_malaysianus.AAC.1
MDVMRRVAWCWNFYSSNMPAPPWHEMNIIVYTSIVPLASNQKCEILLNNSASRACLAIYRDE